MDIAREVNAINHTFAAHGVRAFTWPHHPETKRQVAVVAASYVAHRIFRYAGTRVADVRKLGPELQEALSDLYQMPVPVRFSSTSPLALEVPRRAPKVLKFEQIDTDALAPHQAVIGRSYVYGRAHDWRLDLTDSNQPHCFVAGVTGSGKSVLLQGLLGTLVYSTSPAQMHVYLVDLKNTDLVPFETLPHVRALATDEHSAAYVIRHVFDEMQRRKSEGTGPEPRIVLVIDELRELVYAAAQILSEYLPRLVALGRALGVHVIAATQKPLASELGSIVKAQFPVRVVGALEDSRASYNATGREKAGAELLPGKGAMLLIQDGQPPLRLQTYFVDAPDTLAARAAMRWAGYAPASLTIPTAPPTTTSDLQQQAEAARVVFVDYYDTETGKLRHGGKKAIIGAIFGEGTPTGGIYDKTANDVLEYLKTTTTPEYA